MIETSAMIETNTVIESNAVVEPKNRILDNVITLFVDEYGDHVVDDDSESDDETVASYGAEAYVATDTQGRLEQAIKLESRGRSLAHLETLETEDINRAGRFARPNELEMDMDDFNRMKNTYSGSESGPIFVKVPKMDPEELISRAWDMILEDQIEEAPSKSVKPKRNVWGWIFGRKRENTSKVTPLRRKA